MPKARKRKLPVTPASHNKSSSSNSVSSRTLIRQFHVLLKKQAQLKGQPQDVTISAALTGVQREIEQLGGLRTYQRMSTVGQGNDRGGGSQKVLIEWLKQLDLHNRAQDMCFRLLEVGALKPDNYRSCASWIEAMPMDLHSQHPSILEQDFFLMNELENREKWDIISLSLVLNFVPEPKERGRMLCLARSMLKLDGLLFLAVGFLGFLVIGSSVLFLTLALYRQLPLPCVLNSRYLSFEHLRALMSTIGFMQLQERWKNGGKMAYWLFQKTQPKGSAVEFDRKTVLRQGNRNNFAVLL